MWAAKFQLLLGASLSKSWTLMCTLTPRNSRQKFPVPLNWMSFERVLGIDRLQKAGDPWETARLFWKHIGGEYRLMGLPFLGLSQVFWPIIFSLTTGSVRPNNPVTLFPPLIPLPGPAVPRIYYVDSRP